MKNRGRDVTNESKLILLVEDDDSLRQTLAEALLDEGFDVAATVDGQDALNWLSATQAMPQVIVTDLLMPNVDGWELWNRLNTKSQWKAIPVVILSSALHTRPWPDGAIPAQQVRKPPKLDNFLNLLNSLIAGAPSPSAAC